MKNIKPIYLFSDSQLLFLKNDKQEYYLQSLLTDSLSRSPKAAYIGASNGDQLEFYELFCEAMKIIGIFDCKMISSSFNKDEQKFLDEADLILLAGGDTERGLTVFKERGMEEVLQKKYQQGAIIMGISAGAIQLGWLSFQKNEGEKIQVTEALKFIPFIVLVHTEKENLQEMKSLLTASDTIKRAYEIPFGAGLIYYPDDTMEAVRKPINEFILKDDKLTHTLIFPKS